MDSTQFQETDHSIIWGRQLGKLCLRTFLDAPQPAFSDVNVLSSATPSANEADNNAIELSRRREFGIEFLIKSNMKGWLICLPDKGSQLGIEWKTGDVTQCKIAKLTHVGMGWKPPSYLKDESFCGLFLKIEGIVGQYYDCFNGCQKGSCLHMTLATKARTMTSKMWKIFTGMSVCGDLLQKS